MAGEGCKFIPLRLGQRAEAPQEATRFCVVCGADSFQEAAKGREAARFLNQLAKLDLGIFEAAADEVQWLAAQARRKVRTAAPERDRKRPPPADGHPRN